MERHGSVCVCVERVERVCGAAWECVWSGMGVCVCGAAWECMWSEMRVCEERHGSVCVQRHGSVCGAAWECVERHGSVCVERHESVCGAVRTELPWTRHGVHCLSSGRRLHRSVGLQAQVIGENGETRDT